MNTQTHFSRKWITRAVVIFLIGGLVSTFGGALPASAQQLSASDSAVLFASEPRGPQIEADWVVRNCETNPTLEVKFTLIDTNGIAALDYIDATDPEWIKDGAEPSEFSPGDFKAVVEKNISLHQRFERAWIILDATDRYGAKSSNSVDLKINYRSCTADELRPQSERGGPSIAVDVELRDCSTDPAIDVTFTVTAPDGILSIDYENDSMYESVEAGPETFYWGDDRAEIKIEGLTSDTSRVWVVLSAYDSWGIVGTAIADVAYDTATCSVRDYSRGYIDGDSGLDTGYHAARLDVVLRSCHSPSPELLVFSFLKEDTVDTSELRVSLNGIPSEERYVGPYQYVGAPGEFRESYDLAEMKAEDAEVNDARIELIAPHFGAEGWSTSFMDVLIDFDNCTVSRSGMAMDFEIRFCTTNPMLTMYGTLFDDEGLAQGNVTARYLEDAETLVFDRTKDLNPVTGLKSVNFGEIYSPTVRSDTWYDLLEFDVSARDVTGNSFDAQPIVAVEPGRCMVT